MVTQVIGSFVAELGFRASLGDLHRFTGGIEKASSAMRVLGTVVLGLGAAWAALAAHAIRGFAPLEHAMARLKGLTGTSAEVISNQILPGLKNISTETGQMVAVLSEGIYTARSMGQAVTMSLDTTRQTAKAAVAQIGEVPTVMKLTTTAMETFGHDARLVLDVVAAATRYGDMLPGTLARAMPRSMPLASSLGMDYQELAGMYAYMSLRGLSPDVATERINAILRPFIKPTAQGLEIMEGLTGQQDEAALTAMRRAVDAHGLRAVLASVYGYTGPGGIGKFIEDTQGLEGVEILIGRLSEAEAAKRRNVFTQMAGSGGGQYFDEAYEAGTQTIQYKESVIRAHVAARRLSAGERMNPAYHRLLDKTIEVLEWVDRLDRAGHSPLNAWTRVVNLLEGLWEGIGLGSDIASGKLERLAGAVETLAGAFSWLSLQGQNAFGWVSSLTLPAWLQADFAGSRDMGVNYGQRIRQWFVGSNEQYGPYVGPVGGSDPQPGLLERIQDTGSQARVLGAALAPVLAPLAGAGGLMGALLGGAHLLERGLDAALAADRTQGARKLAETKADLLGKRAAGLLTPFERDHLELIEVREAKDSMFVPGRFVLNEGPVTDEERRWFKRWQAAKKAGRKLPLPPVPPPIPDEVFGSLAGTTGGMAGRRVAGAGLRRLLLGGLIGGPLGLALSLAPIVAPMIGDIAYAKTGIDPAIWPELAKATGGLANLRFQAAHPKTHQTLTSLYEQMWSGLDFIQGYPQRLRDNEALANAPPPVPTTSSPLVAGRREDDTFTFGTQTGGAPINPPRVTSHDVEIPTAGQIAKDLFGYGRRGVAGGQWWIEAFRPKSMFELMAEDLIGPARLGSMRHNLRQVQDKAPWLHSLLTGRGLARWVYAQDPMHAEISDLRKGHRNMGVGHSLMFPFDDPHSGDSLYNWISLFRHPYRASLPLKSPMALWGGRLISMLRQPTWLSFLSATGRKRLRGGYETEDEFRAEWAQLSQMSQNMDAMMADPMTRMVLNAGMVQSYIPNYGPGMKAVDRWLGRRPMGEVSHLVSRLLPAWDMPEGYTWLQLIDEIAYGNTGIAPPNPNPGQVGYWDVALQGMGINVHGQKVGGGLDPAVWPELAKVAGALASLQFQAAHPKTYQTLNKMYEQMWSGLDFIHGMRTHHEFGTNLVRNSLDRLGLTGRSVLEALAERTSDQYPGVSSHLMWADKRINLALDSMNASLERYRGIISNFKNERLRADYYGLFPQDGMPETGRPLTIWDTMAQQLGLQVPLSVATYFVGQEIGKLNQQLAPTGLDSTDVGITAGGALSGLLLGRHIPGIRRLGPRGKLIAGALAAGASVAAPHMGEEGELQQWLQEQDWESILTNWLPLVASTVLLPGATSGLFKLLRRIGTITIGGATLGRLLIPRKFDEFAEMGAAGQAMVKQFGALSTAEMAKYRIYSAFGATPGFFLKNFERLGKAFPIIGAGTAWLNTMFPDFFGDIDPELGAAVVEATGMDPETFEHIQGLIQKSVSSTGLFGSIMGNIEKRDWGFIGNSLRRIGKSVGASYEGLITETTLGAAGALSSENLGTFLVGMVEILMRGLLIAAEVIVTALTVATNAILDLTALIRKIPGLGLPEEPEPPPPPPAGAAPGTVTTNAQGETVVAGTQDITLPSGGSTGSDPLTSQEMLHLSPEDRHAVWRVVGMRQRFSGRHVTSALEENTMLGFAMPEPGVDPVTAARLAGKSAVDIAMETGPQAAEEFMKLWPLRWLDNTVAELGVNRWSNKVALHTELEWRKRAGIPLTADEEATYQRLSNQSENRGLAIAAALSSIGGSSMTPSQFQRVTGPATSGFGGQRPYAEPSFDYVRNSLSQAPSGYRGGRPRPEDTMNQVVAERLYAAFGFTDVHTAPSGHGGNRPSVGPRGRRRTIGEWWADTVAAWQALFDPATWGWRTAPAPVPAASTAGASGPGGPLIGDMSVSVSVQTAGGSREEVAQAAGEAAGEAVRNAVMQQWPDEESSLEY